jgi:hypothetical protein
MTLFRKYFLASPFFFAAALFLGGCATRQLVPVPDGGNVDIDRRSVTKSDGEVTVTFVGSAWKGEPGWIEGVVTPIYAVVENRSATSISFGYTDVLIFDEQRVQYAALTPETVATRVQALSRHYSAPPPPPPLLILRRHPFWYHPLWYDPWWDSSPYGYQRTDVSGIYAQALPVGSVRPQSRVQGFIYFAPLPTAVEQITVSLRYERSGESGRHEMSFPFRFETSR